MRKFKKISAVLSILLAFSISVGTFPLSALAQYYTANDESGGFDYTYNGEIQAPNSNVLSSLGAFGASAEGELPFNASFQTAPSFSAVANNNWSTSLSSKTFSIVAIGNVGDYCDITLSNSSLKINVYRYEEDGGRTISSCSPVVSVATTQNVSSGSVSGNPVAIQTSEVLPLAAFKEDTLVTRVESIRNDPNNVKVTVGVDSTIESYGARFQRIENVSNWIGHVANAEDGGFYLGDVQRANDAQLPQGVKIAASSPSVSRSVDILRDSKIIDSSVTQPKCTQWQDGSWRVVQHVHCVTYALSADGRTGRADYYDSAEAGGWGRDLIGLTLVAIGLYLGFDGGLLQGILSGTGDFTALGLTGSALSSAGTELLTAATTGIVAAASGASVIGTVESTIASSPPYGTEKAWVWTWSELPPAPTITTCTAPQTLVNGVCTNPVTICTLPKTMVNGVCTDPPATAICSTVQASVPCSDPRAVSYVGNRTVGTAYYTYNSCTSAILSTDISDCSAPVTNTVSSLPQSVTVIVCSGNAPTWNPSTNSCVGVVANCTAPQTLVNGVCTNPTTTCTAPQTLVNGVCTNPVTTCTAPQTLVNGVCTTPSTTTTVTPPVGGTPVNQDGGGPNNQGGQNQGGQGNQGSPSVTISADPARVQSGGTSTISWTLNNVNNCTITKNGTQWKSNVSSSGNSTPPETITSQTIYTITCPSTSPESVTVNILPVFQEF